MVSVAGSTAFDVLKAQDATTSQTIIEKFSKNEVFNQLAKEEARAIIQRDNEDGEKLAAGIKISVDKGVIPANPGNDPYVEIDVLGKTPDDVVKIIQDHMGDAAKKGCVVVLCGLSGTGKGTTVARLAESIPNAVTWSNGNVFRSITLLAATWCEKQGMAEFDPKVALTADKIKEYMGCLSFGKFGGTWDIRIQGMGIDTTVGAIKNTDLKSRKVGKNIPTVAKVTQGDVILFAVDALKKMGEGGLVTLLEGREQTVNYVPTKYRYVLKLSDESIIGKRRLAQKLAAAALMSFEAPSDSAVAKALENNLMNLSSDKSEGSDSFNL